MNSTSSEIEHDLQRYYLQREKCSHISKAARSATIANILAPLLCIPMFQEEVRPSYFTAWLMYMFVMVTVRTIIVYKLNHRTDGITEPERDLKYLTFAVGIVGFGWGLGWPLMTPDLSMVDRMIYVYMTTAAMISSMFAYSVNRPTFYAFTLPIMAPAISTILWPTHIFPWPFLVGMTTLYLVVLSIANNFSKVFEDSVRLRFRNEQLFNELANERDQSVAANIAKSKFIAVASHDLRQPLQAMNVNLELFDLTTLVSKNSLLLQKIKNSVSTLNTMFDALLNMSKLDAYNTKPNNQTFHLSELTESVLEIVQAPASNKGLELKINSPDYLVKGDPLLLQQILVNLVLNAIQYTEAGSIDISFGIQSNCLLFSVSDSGVGISDNDQQNIFKEFYRVDITRGKHEGLGLGLTIVKRLCNLIDASIHVESTLGKGSIFTVATHCPVTTNANPNADLQDLALSVPVAPSEKFIDKFIAIIEDNEVILNAYTQMLSSRGAHVVLLSESEEELKSQLEIIDHIDCILCDYRLKQTTGDVIIEKLRENFNYEIPAVIVTADTSPAHIHTFERLNVQILYKPVTFQHIIATIEKLI
jgi:signal transduction histidine kinase